MKEELESDAFQTVSATNSRQIVAILNNSGVFSGFRTGPVRCFSLECCSHLLFPMTTSSDILQFFCDYFKQIDDFHAKEFHHDR
jgi:hypothetical protein